MRHKALTNNKVLDPITVDICEGRPVRLREQDIARILCVVIVHEDMPLEADLTGRAAFLLEPRQPPAMSFQARHHVVQAIAIHVVDSHFRPARIAL